MARAFRPSVHISVGHNYMGEFKENVLNGFILVEFPNYKKVQQRMKELLEISDNNIVTIFRHRRGEWGEWREVWKSVNNKPTISVSGWM